MVTLGSWVQPIENLFNRLNHLAVSRFGCTVEYIHFVDTKEDHRELRAALLQSGSVERSGVLYLPVIVSFRCTGAAKVSGHLPVNGKSRQQLKDLLQFILETALDFESRIEMLDRLEARVKHMDLDHVEPSNVIPFQRIPEERLSLSHAPTVPRRLNSSVPCLIESESFSDIKRLAQELHELSGRYAFVYFGDLTLARPTDLLELGAITLFIPDITALNRNQQNLLKVYFTQRPIALAEGPQIIAGSIWSFTDLRDQKRVDAELLKCVSVGYLRMSRPYED